MKSLDSDDFTEGVAIIGMACRFPGADNINELWQNLCKSKESITFFNDDELDNSISTEIRKNSNYIKAKGLIKDADKFDAAFFKINPREAAIMDPQQRIFLEIAWQALEDAGYDPESYDGLIGVFGGTGFNSYYFKNILSNPNILETHGEHQTSIANGPDYLATRVSYKLNLKGPSLSIYTGCSLSLISVCLGFDSLMSYQCDMALCGGSFIKSPLNSGYFYQQGGMESADGHCRPFDAKANGTVFSDGAGIVVLKRLSDAINDGDHIYAVIRGTAINNDGSNKMSFTAPSVDAQAQVIEMAQASADIDPETITYIETHGTGTPVGDPIEFEALTQAFRVQTQKKNFCALGSIKSNIGHLDAAAGVAGLIKTALMLQNKMIPPTLHFQQPNPKIDLSNSPFYINNELINWGKNSLPRRAGVTSLGVGGTNAHVILEEAPEIKLSSQSRSKKLILLSAKTKSALEKISQNLVKYLQQNPEINLADIAYTLQMGRKRFEHRRMFVCNDVEQEFREQVDICSEILETHLSFDIRNIIFPNDISIEEANQKIKQTYITQPVLFVIEYALAKLWMSWGIIPSAFVGHSIGEYVAACLSGVFSVQDALSIVAIRGHLMQSRPPGSMIAIPLSEEEIKPYLNNELSIAVINGPALCVVSGENRNISQLEQKLSEDRIDFRRLHTSHAFHSKMMEPILDEFTDYLNNVSLNPPKIPFSDCLQELLKEPNRVFLEVGPGHTLTMLARQQPGKKEEQKIISSIRHPKEKIPDLDFILRTLGQLWQYGIQIDWKEFYKNEKRKRVPLPTYPFERKRYWIDPGKRNNDINSTFDISFEEAEKTSRSEQQTESQTVDLGGSSFMALRLFAQIEQIFGNKLPVSTLYKAPTIELLANIVRQDQPVAPWSCLVEIQKGESKTPLFLVHGAGGNILIYRDLARRLGPEYPVYGFQSQGLDGKKTILTKIEDMASNYIQEIKSIQPEGPYFIGGYCMGGSVAYEMAQQLQKSGEKVGLVILFETYNYSNIPEQTFLDKIYYYIQKADFHWRNFLLLNPKKKWTFILEKVKVAIGRRKVLYGILKSRIGNIFHKKEDQSSILSKIWKTNDQAAFDYIPKPFSGKIVQFLPIKEYAHHLGPELGWEKLAQGELETHRLPIYPAGMLVEPFVELLAEKLKICLENASINIKSDMTISEEA
ncbi:MAG: type I polyketide synthase [Candidatus Helarchaeota archaeon]